MTKERSKNDEYAARVVPYLEKIEAYVKHGCTEKDVYEAYGIGKTTWFRYKKDHPELTELLYKAKKFAEIELVNLAYKIATGYYVDETVTKTLTDEDGKEQISVTTRHKYIKPEPDILKFIMINRYPDDWKNDPSGIDLRKRLVELREKIEKSEEGMVGV